MALSPAGVRRKKTARVACRLEDFLGTPRQARHLPPMLEMLIATILSQNTSDKNSHRAYTGLKTAFPTWKGAAEAPLRNLREAIRIGGMARLKAPRIQNVLHEVHDRYGSYSLERLRRKSSPRILKELTSLDGVGVKTAACVLLFSLSRDIFPVDTHVHRIANRLGLVETSTPEKTFEAMRDLLPKGKAYSLHTNMIRFGRKICRSASPACGGCPLYRDCCYPGKRTSLRRHSSGADTDFMVLDHVRA